MSTVPQRLALAPQVRRVLVPRNSRFTRISLIRTYASTTQGDTQSATNLGTPSPKPSDSPAEGDIKSSRAQEGRASETGGSVAKPISNSNQEKGQVGADEEGTDPIKSDPNKPASQKKEETLKQGETPLDPADK